MQYSLARDQTVKFISALKYGKTCMSSYGVLVGSLISTKSTIDGYQLEAHIMFIFHTLFEAALIYAKPPFDEYSPYWLTQVILEMLEGPS